jgi:uncharacterized protein YjbJ (UPF0337 family)
MSTRDYRTPDDEGTYVDSELPVDAVVPDEDDRFDDDDRLDDENRVDAKDRLEHGTDDVVGKVKEGFGKITHNERLEAEGEAQQAEADLERTRDDADDTFRRD